jgi:tRNA 2-selenouridine synthase
MFDKILVMIQELSASDFISKKKELPLIDVRSPVEYQKGHVFSAINVELFSDKEREAVGTTYKKDSKETAINLGLEFAIPKIDYFINRVKQIAPNKKVLIYCARGGMRSHSFAKMLEKAGFEVFLLINGYKAFRKHVLDSFSDKAKIVVLGGMTGSGKTDILKELEQKGEQILDLEALGSHKGSAFGGLGQGIQPTCQQFENDIFEKWHNFDFSKRIWVENESRKIGKATIPEALFQQLQKAKLIELVVEKKIRAKRLVKEYAHFDKALLKESILKIKNRLGDQTIKQLLDALEKEDYMSVALIVLVYYDKSYQYGVSKRIGTNVSYFPYNHDEHASGVQDLICNA